MTASQLLTQLRDLRTGIAPHPRRPDVVVQLGLELERTRNLADIASQDIADAAEQVAIAALETNHLVLANTLIARLSAHYRDQPHGLHRVNYLHGMLLEARGDLVAAKEYYLQKLRDDDADVAVRKRLAALHLSSPIVDLSTPSTSTTKAHPTAVAAAAAGPYRSASLSQTEGISLLVAYLDTYYLDLASWLSLASAYASLAQYRAAQTCLAHAAVLSPHDPFVHLKLAETAYTLGELPLAWKGFCRVIEMSTEVDDARDALNKGAARRAAVGAKLCIPRLRASEYPTATTATSSSTGAAAEGDDEVLTPQHLGEMDLLLTKLLLQSASATKTGPELRTWLSLTGPESSLAAK
ncbi:hypothetical protein JCM3774_005472 [Rhodotorula dairenensis]